jgi:type I restriction enzyme, S subunit
MRSGSVPVMASGGLSGFHDTAMVQGPGVVIGRKGTLGSAYYVDEPYWPSDTTLWVKQFGDSHPRFVYYFLSAFDALRLDVGSANPTLNRNHVHQIHVSWPPPDEQRRIAGVLGALDDKIEHNDALSRRLADLARLQFESAVAHWRPDSRDGKLADLAAPIRERADDSAPYIGLEAMPRGSTILSEWAIEDAPSGQAMRFRRGDVLFGKLRPYFKKVGVAPIDGRCSTEILVLRPRAPHLWGLLLGNVSSDAFISYCVQVSRGTKMPRSEWKDASAFPVLIPNEELAAELTQAMRLLYDAAIALVQENRHLALARDALLPKLVSGALPVPDSYDPDDSLGTVAGVAGVAIP